VSELSTSSPATAAMEMASRALAHVLDLGPDSLRPDTPLRDIGADSVAILVFGDVVQATAAQSALAGFRVDNARLRQSATVGDLAAAISWDRR
jgi:hypothetical protein